METIEAKGRERDDQRTMTANETTIRLLGIFLNDESSTSERATNERTRQSFFPLTNVSSARKYSPTSAR